MITILCCKRIESTYDHWGKRLESPAFRPPRTSAPTDRFPFIHRHLSSTRLSALISYAPFKKRYAPPIIDSNLFGGSSDCEKKTTFMTCRDQCHFHRRFLFNAIFQFCRWFMSVSLCLITHLPFQKTVSISVGFCTFALSFRSWHTYIKARSFKYTQVKYGLQNNLNEFLFTHFNREQTLGVAGFERIQSLSCHCVSHSFRCQNFKCSLELDIYLAHFCTPIFC